VSSSSTTPAGLILKLSIYFAILLGSIILLAVAQPDMLKLMPLGGTDAIEIATLQIDEEGIAFNEGGGIPDREEYESQPIRLAQVALIALNLSMSLGATLLVMIPIAWTYMAIKRETGFGRNFVRSLLILPICATTIVLLIQDSLALAFGLAALVAAVRFRVALDETIDGIYIFSAICVGLSAGIGYLGIGAILALFFCMTNAVLWHLDYGQNPIDDAKREKKLKRTS
jgi:hypothetical protein